MKKLLLRGSLFLIVLSALLYVISMPFRLEDVRTADTYEELYSMKPHSCDAVLVGASNCYAYFQSPLAWRDYGITVCNMGLPASMQCLPNPLHERLPAPELEQDRDHKWPE